MNMKKVWILVCAMGLSAVANAADAQAQLHRWEQAAGQAGVATRGELFFKSKHGNDWSCASCNGMPPTQMGKHASTGKAIEPLAPAANAKRLTDDAKVDKWFRRNCKDVLSRECTAIEKADVLAYLVGVKK